MIQIVTAVLMIMTTINASGAELPRVKMQTNQGTIVLELQPDKAPMSVENFLSYVNDGFYDGTVFHRVIDGFMVQGGGFTADFQKKQTKAPIENEADNGLTNDVGTIAMARTGDPNSATAQFFINIAKNEFLNHSAPTPQGWGYAVFGKVIEGMEVVNTIKSLPTGADGPFAQNVPKTAVVIENVTVVADGKN